MKISGRRRSRTPSKLHSDDWIANRRLGWTILAISWALVSVLYLLVQRDTTFAVDEFDWIGLAGSAPLHGLIEPLNGHLIVLPLVVFRIGLELFGTSHLGFTLVELVFLISVSLGIYVFSRERLGPLLAFAPAVIPLTLGAGWPLLSAPLIGIEWAAAITFGLWALIAVERNSRRSDVAACILLVLSLASFSIAMPFLVACAIAIFLGESRWRRSWIVIIPTVLYAVWYVWANSQSTSAPIDIGSVIWLPAYVMDSVIAVSAAVAGFNLDYGPATTLGLDGFDRGRFVRAVGLALMLLLLLAWSIRYVVKSGRPVGPLLVVLAIPLLLWTSQGLLLDEFRRPIEYRYLFGSTVAVMLVLAELFRPVRASVPLVLTTLGLVAVSAIMGLVPFSQGRNAQLALSTEARAVMSALEIAGDNADPSFTPSTDKLTPQAQFIFIHTGQFLEMSDRYGSPALSVRELKGQAEATRQAADITLVRALEISLEEDRRQNLNCRQIRAERGEDDVVSALLPGHVGIRSNRPRSLFLGRFADSEAVRLDDLERDTAMRFEIPEDATNLPWRIRATGTVPLTVCSDNAD